MNDLTSQAKLDPNDIAAWASQPFEQSFSYSMADVEGSQLVALQTRFDVLRRQVSALDRLAARHGIDQIESFEQAAPLLFDHRVYKSYPTRLVEQREFHRLTRWLQRLTKHDLSGIPMDDVRSVDEWIERLDEHGMMVSHSTGTSGKLSFFPRSQDEWPAQQGAFFESTRAATGVDRRTEYMATFYPGYRDGHTTGTKMQKKFSEVSAGGDEARYCLYEYKRSSDLLSMAARLRQAEERGELNSLDLDPDLLAERARLIEAGRNRDADLRRWFTELAKSHRGERVRITGVTADMIQIALAGRDRGLKCDFAPGSVLFVGGGFKGLEDVPADWEEILKEFFCVDRVTSMYAMTESMGFPPLCPAGHYHFFPYTIPILLDIDGNPLPREGVQTGRLGLFDLLAESYWGGILSGDRVIIHWDDDCECGWKGVHIERDIRRFSEITGTEDRITCAGTEQVYSEFMDYIARI